jgi:hypothetical protein
METGDRTFTPHQIHGNFDDTVVVTLRGSGDRHSFTVPALNIDQVVEEGKTVEVRFVVPTGLAGSINTANADGIYPYYCRFHGTPRSGMHGFLVFH